MSHDSADEAGGGTFDHAQPLSDLEQEGTTTKKVQLKRKKSSMKFKGRNGGVSRTKAKSKNGSKETFRSLDVDE